MISKFIQKTAQITAFMVSLTVLVGCSALTDAKSADLIKPDNQNPPSTQNITLSLPEGNAVPSEKSGTIDSFLVTEDALPEDLTVEEKVEFYLDKLKDKEFIGTYGDGYTWYTAAEELGMIGKPAIPGLIEKLKTQDDYERALALYALLLASQQDNVKQFTNGEYIEVNLDFNKDNHPDMIDKAWAWWEKFKENF